FINIKNEYRPIAFNFPDVDLTELKKSGYGGVVLSSEDLTYTNILEKLKKQNLKAIYYDEADKSKPSGWTGGEFAAKYPESINKMLVMREYSCNENETVRRKVEDGTLMSVVAYDVDYHDIIDLRGNISNGYVDWEVPRGNWVILQFLCRYNTESQHVNYLSYEASQKFINLTYKRFTDNFSEYIDTVVEMTLYHDIQYLAPNRRSWDDEFNEIFLSEYGFDPAPYYPALFFDIGEQTAHMKAFLINCRANMLINGFFKAVSDFTKSHGLLSTGHVAEPKTIASPWIFGDGMLYQKLAGAAGMNMVHAYGYGANGLKLTSSAANNFDRELVVCEIFGDYVVLDEDIMYREAMNVFGKGINYIIPNMSNHAEFKEFLPDFNDFAARCQTMLQYGRHVCDIAVIYPIYSLQSQIYMFEQSTDKFEFPATPTNADYMNIINIILNYTCRDLTILHPEALEERCYTNNGMLYLSNEVNFEQFKVVVIPGTAMISIKNLRLIKKFYDEGGKIIATTELPSMAFELGNDEEVNEIVKHIFGVSADEINTFTNYYTNKNNNGGVAYFLLSELTAADGTVIVDALVFNKMLESFNIPFDIEISDKPKISNSGILNLNLPAFMVMNAHNTLKNSGVFNYIHRKYAGCDIFYISNSTNIDYEGEISFRGKYLVEEWNPHTGKIKKIDCEYHELKGEVYTKIEANINKIQSMFYVCVTNNK
ncbi:MAG: hypothetical protein FWF15_04770, partial [Oscillospiraceae bacterium]|nr:hypothetical protein [Oscillospiraceae bacterium]